MNKSIKKISIMTSMLLSAILIYLFDLYNPEGIASIVFRIFVICGIYILFSLFSFFIIYPLVYRIFSIFTSNIKKKEEEEKKALFLKYYREFKYYEAMSIIKEINDIDFKERYSIIIAYCYLRTGMYILAIEKYNIELKKNPKDKDIFFNRALAKYKLNTNDTEDLEKIYNIERPFMILNREMYLQFNDTEQKKATQSFENKLSINKIGNIFGVEAPYYKEH